MLYLLALKIHTQIVVLIMLCCHDQEGEEAGEVTKQSLLADALVVVVWAGEVRKMVVTITDQEAMVSNVVHNETIRFRRPSMNRRNHSRGSYFFDLTVLLIPGGTFLLF